MVYRYSKIEQRINSNQTFANLTFMKKITPDISAASLLQKASTGAIEEDPVIIMLEAIDRNGSINQAAKSVGLSYKGAWERIDALNNLSVSPLVKKKTGGSGGGGTELTEEGKIFLVRAKMFQREIGKLFGFFQKTPEDAFSMLKTLKGMEMRISARNVWLGNVKSIDAGIVNSVVTVALKGKDTIVSVITNSSVERLELESGKEVLAIVKAPDVLLSHDINPETISASNILTGPISRIVPGKVNDEVTVEIDGGNTVTSILTSNSVKRLGLEPGSEVSAVIKASNVLLALP